ncbi:MAG: hypothetical protein JST24_04540 [Acidobacteria bacterium]|nr:hypothetical protein [Acidobacteriota bacterium]
MRFHLLAAILLLAVLPLSAHRIGKLPDWANTAIQKAEASPTPGDADRWVLFDRTEFAYVGDGEIRTHRFRVVKVLTDRGTDAATFVLRGLGGGASKVKKLKGWNLRPDGELDKLDSDDVIAIEKVGDSTGVDNSRLTGATLDRVVKGSYVVFESLQSFRDPMGPSGIAGVMETDPIFRWEFATAKQEGWFTNLSKVRVVMDLRHFQPWTTSLKVVPNQEASVDLIPAIPKNEQQVPWFWNAMPRIQVRFLDPALHDSPDLSAWDGTASWMENSFAAHTQPLGLPSVVAGHDRAGLKAISSWMSRELIYKQVYLTPERGFTPLDAAEVVRRRYGDCKDLTSCFIAAASKAGFKAYPVLARIVEGRIEDDEPVFPGAFNHVIAAVRLEGSLGLPSEVVTSDGRYLLVDPTARLTPLGYLPEAHRGRRVMICAGQKAIWVSIPDSTIEPRSLKTNLEASVEANGTLSGTVTIEEIGDANGLRTAALNRTSKGLRDYLLDSVLVIPSDGQFEILKHSDPLDVSKPFTLEMTFIHPRGVVLSQTEMDLDPLGVFRVLPGVIQPHDQARKYPVVVEGGGLKEVHALIQFPKPIQPFLLDKTLDGPFRHLTWSAKADSKGSGSLVSLSLATQWKSASFEFGRQEQGVAAWAKLRKDSRTFLDDALAFKIIR